MRTFISHTGGASKPVLELSLKVWKYFHGILISYRESFVFDLDTSVVYHAV